MQRMALVLSLTIGGSLSLTAFANDRYETAAGKVVALPAIGGQSCSEMENTLSEIDATRYRENAPTPHDPADQPLYSYEMELARQHYQSCVEGDTGASLQFMNGSLGN